MSLTIEINGVPVGHRHVAVNADHIEGTSGTFTFDPSITVMTGDTISVEYDSKILATGTIKSTSTNASSTTGYFSSSSTVTYPTWTQDRQLRSLDQAIIDEFLIDSFARGWAREDHVVGRD